MTDPTGALLWAQTAEMKQMIDNAIVYRRQIRELKDRLATEQSQKQYLREQAEERERQRSMEVTMAKNRLTMVEAELRTAAGMLSTHPQFSNDHPEKVLQFIRDNTLSPAAEQPIYDEAVIKAREHLESTAAQELRGTTADNPVSDSPTFPANTTRIVLCDSDASHAFKVNRKAIPPGYAMVPVEQLDIIEHLVSIPEHKRNDNEFLRGTIACIAGCHRTMLAAGGKKA